ncbi:MAG: hypothetical protein U9P70_03365 [Patescibacteria group bacterium]|nr:hypothetical protein [Patescibacteria group bacterium]
MTETEKTIRIVVKGEVNRNVEYTDDMTHKEVLASAGVDIDSLEYGTIAIDGKIVIDKKDLNKKIKEGQQVISVAPKANNG